MPSTVKWGKNEYAVSVDAAAGVPALKAQLFSLTGVPPDRQKLMSKAWKGILKDDAALPPLEGALISLMGSADDVAKPVASAVFVEDLPKSAIVQAGGALPAGLVNLGNTCYANAALECLRAVPELRAALVEYKNKRGGGGSSSSAAASASSFGPLTTATAELLTEVEAAGDAVAPAAFLGRLRAVYPQYGERGPQGVPKQQDSEEFLGALLQALSAELTAPSAGVPALNPRASNVVDTLFGVETEETLTCLEAPPGGGPPETVVKRDFARKLLCNIEGGAGKTVQINHLHEGIALGLGGEVEKAADSLGGRNALWKRTARLDVLPRYLTVQMMRFFWKATPDSRDHAGVKCKMLRPVTFPTDTFDVFEFASARVQASLRAARDKYAEEVSPTAAKKAKTEPPAAVAASAAAAASAPAAGAGAGEEDDELAAALKMSLEGGGSGSSSGSGDGRPIGYGLPPGFRGVYELFAVVTHKGRSADSGHYMGWQRVKRTNEWLVFDDDSVSPTTSEYMATYLKGGGDDNMSYLLFFRAKE